MVGDASVLSAAYERYNANPGNGGFGIRSESQLAVVTEATSTSGGNVLRITAENDGSGNHLHGGVKVLRPATYYKAEIRMRTSGDATVPSGNGLDAVSGNGVTSGVGLLWPTANETRFPSSLNPEGPWPAGGEIDFTETFNNRVTRSPVQSYIHVLDPAAVPPYTASDDLTAISYEHYVVDGDSGSGGISQADWIKYELFWSPDGIGVALDNGDIRWLTLDPDLIPAWDMELTLQLDAWDDKPPDSPVTMDVDYIALYPWIPNPIVVQTAGRFDDYTNNSGSRPLGWKYELVDPQGGLLATTQKSEAKAPVCHWSATGPPLTFSGEGTSVRTSTLEVPVNDLKFSPSLPGSYLNPDAGNRVLISGGIELDGGWVWWLLATLLIDEATLTARENASTTRLDLLDMTSLLDVELETSFTWPGGSTVESVLQRLMALALPASARWSVTPTGFTAPAGSLEVGDNVSAVINELAGGCGHELVADETGLIQTRPIAPSALDGAAGRWRYGPTDLAVESTRATRRRSTPRGVVIKGGTSQSSDPTICLKVVDSDPRSSSYYSGGPVSLDERTFTWIESVPQANAAGLGIMRREGDGPGRVELTVLPNPAMRVGDVLDLDDPIHGLSGEYMVMGFELPLEVNERMKVDARRFWRPDVGVRPPIELNPGFKTAFSDDFDRADEDLQKDGEDGWTELGWSWGVVGNQAVQRYPGWSMALVNTRMQSSAHSASLVVARLSNGRKVGPVVRSPGSFDGWALLVDPNGLVTLESWVSGSLSEVVASHSLEASPVGSTLLLEASGDTIAGKVDGSTVISISDSRHLGERVGMLAYGDAEAIAPAADSFVAAQV